MASEVGNGQVSIFPVFKGFRSKTNAEVEGAGREASSRFGKAFARGSRDAGGTGGKSFVSAFNSSAKDLGDLASKKLKANVSAASKDLSRARLAEQDSAGKVKVAEAALAEARSKGAAGSARVIAAEERLASVQRKLTEAQTKTASSSKSLKDAQAELADATEAAGSSSEQASNRFVRGWAGLKSKLSSSLRSSVDGATKQASSRADAGGRESGNRFSNAFKGALGALAAVFAVDKIKSFFGEAISGSGDLEQSVGAVEAVFKGSAGQMAKWSKDAETNVGLTKNEFNELGTLIGSQLKNGGTAMKNLAPETNKLIKLGADLASMYGGTSREAVEALSSALKGERDPIEKYGVSLNEAKIKAEAASLGFKAAGGALSDEAKQAATMSLIMKQTADSHGNYAKEMTTFAGQQSIMAAQWGNIKTAIGDKFLPVLTLAATQITSKMMPALAGMVDKIDFTGIGAKLAPFTKFIGEVGTGAKDLVAGFTLTRKDAADLGDELGGFVAVGSKIRESFDKVGAVAKTTFGFLAPLVTNIVAAFAPLAPQIFDLVTNFSPLSIIFQALAPMLPQIGAMVSMLANMVAGLVAQIVPLYTSLMAQIVPVFTTLVQAVLPVVISLVTTLVGAFAPLVMTLVSSLAPILIQLATMVLPMVVSAFTAIIGAVMPVVNILLAMLLPVIQSLLPVVTTVFQWIATIVQSAMQVIQGVIQVVTGIITGNWSQVWEGIKNILGGVWNYIVGAVQTALNLVKGLVGVAMGVIKGLWNGAWSAISGALGGVWSGITSVIKLGADKVVGFFREMGPKATDSLKALPGQLGTIGKQMIEGLIGGIKDMASRAAGAVGDVVGGAINGAKKLLGIASPSKVFKQFGRWVSEGLGIGVTASASKAVDAVKKLSAKVAKAGTDGIKEEAKRLQEERRKQNKKIADYNKNLSKSKGSSKSSLGSITAAEAKKIAKNRLGSNASKKAISAETKRIQEARRQQNKRITEQNKRIAASNKKLGLKRKDSLGALSAADAEKQAKKNLKRQLAGQRSAQKLIDAQAKLTASVWRKGAEAGTTSLLKALSGNGKFKRGASQDVRTATLTDIAKAREVVAERIKKANAKLAEMVQMQNQVKDSITGELDLKAGVSKYTERGDKGAFQTVASNVKALASRARTFAGKLKDLAKAGIPTGLIQEVAGYGTEAGIGVANALLSGSKSQVKSLAKDFASLNSWAGQAGKNVADDFFGIGMDAQRGIIKGLNADDSKLKAAAKRMTDTLTKEVKKNLGVHSPSKVFADEIGKMLPAGITVGAEAGSKDMNRKVAAMVKVPTVEASTMSVTKTRTAADGSSSKAQVVININVSASPGMDEMALAQKIKSVLKYELEGV